MSAELDTLVLAARDARRKTTEARRIAAALQVHATSADNERRALELIAVNLAERAQRLAIVEVGREVHS